MGVTERMRSEQGEEGLDSSDICLEPGLLFKPIMRAESALVVYWEKRCEYSVCDELTSHINPAELSAPRS